MNRYIKSSFLFIFIEKFGDCFDWFVVTSVSRSKNNEDSNGIFIEIFTDFASVEAVFGFTLDGDNTSFDIKVTSKFSNGKRFIL